MKPAILCLILTLGGCAAQHAERASSSRIVSPTAKAVSQPVPVNQVESAAIWIHPTQPDRSLLLVTNERRGLEVHTLDGALLKNVDDGCRPQYVDLLYDFPLDGKPADLALATCTGEGYAGVRVWRIDAAKDKLKPVIAAPTLKVLGGDAPIGLCTYTSRKTGKAYFFVTSHEGLVEQYEMTESADHMIEAKKVRSIDLADEIKGCCADDDRGVLYVGQTNVGIQQFDAEPTGALAGKLVIKAGEHDLLASIKGPALYRAANGRGYLLVISQGKKGGHPLINVYDRQGDNAFVLTIDPASSPFGPLDHSSGLAVTNRPTTADFPAGVLAVNDQINPNASEDFKLYSWADIAKAGGLMIDVDSSPRRSPTR